MKVVIYYHRACADGFGAAWSVLAKYAHDLQVSTMDLASSTVHNVRAYPAEYNIPIDNLEEDCSEADVYLVDFSLPPKELDRIALVANKVIVLDHHASAIKKLENYSNPKVELVLDITHSGAMLTWKYMWKETPHPTLIQFLEDHDLWKKQYPQSTPLARGIYHSGIITNADWSQFDMLAQSEDHLMEMIILGNTVIDVESKLLDRILVESSYLVDFKGHKAVAASIPYSLGSSAGEKINSHPNVPFSITHDFVRYEEGFPAGYHRLSLRSHKAYGKDVGTIAESVGGGGHKNAAGVKVDRLHFYIVEDFFSFYAEEKLSYPKRPNLSDEFQYVDSVRSLLLDMVYTLGRYLSGTEKVHPISAADDYQRILRVIHLGSSLEQGRYWDSLKDKVETYNDALIKAHQAIVLMYVGDDESIAQAREIRNKINTLSLTINRICDDVYYQLSGDTNA